VATSSNFDACGGHYYESVARVSSQAYACWASGNRAGGCTGREVTTGWYQLDREQEAAQEAARRAAQKPRDCGGLNILACNLDVTRAVVAGVAGEASRIGWSFMDTAYRVTSENLTKAYRAMEPIAQPEDIPATVAEETETLSRLTTGLLVLGAVLSAMEIYDAYQKGGWPAAAKKGAIIGVSVVVGVASTSVCEAASLGWGSFACFMLGAANAVSTKQVLEHPEPFRNKEWLADPVGPLVPPWILP
jgi:hypothetical protein